MSGEQTRAGNLSALHEAREHVLRTVEGLSEEELDRAAAPSGWSPRQMLNHLLFDDEIFWIQAVLGADEAAISRLRDGWSAPALPGPELTATYRAEITRGDALLERADLDGPPAWWPPPEVFGGPRLTTGWDVLLRVLSETSVHAGHLDMARERIDGRQDLVAG